MSSGNPAGRLLNIVEEARSLQDSLPLRNGWLKILNIDKDDHAQLMFRLGRVMSLPEQVMTDIREHFPDEEKDQEYWLKQVRNALLQGSFSSSSYKWDAVKQHLDDHTVRYLKLASAMLRGVGEEQLLCASQLNNIRKKLEEILSDLEATNLTPEAKAMIRRHPDSVKPAPTLPLSPPASIF